MASTIPSAETGERPGSRPQRLGPAAQLSCLRDIDDDLRCRARLGARGRDVGSIGSAVVVFWGVGLLVAGSLSASRGFRRPNLRSRPGFHQPNGAVFFGHMGWFGRLCPGASRPEPRWQVWPRYTLLTSGALAVLFLVTAALAISSSAPLHPWAGLIQRLVLAVWFPCLIALAARLLQVSRSPSAMPVAEHPVSVV